VLTGLVSVVLMAVCGCGGSSAQGGSPSVGDPTVDKLAQIVSRGTLVLATDPAYAPQSYRVPGAKRLAKTNCTANQMTGNQMAGYDADTSKLVARSLHVEPCFVAPTWSQMISGDWGDRWDIAIASMGITRERMQGLYFTQPYSAEAERFFVRTGSPYTEVSQLSGKRLGGCVGCFAEAYIQGTLDAPGQSVKFEAKNGTFVGYDLESHGLRDVARGKLDAFLCGVAVGAKAINEGRALRPIGDDQYVAYLSGAIDRSSGLQVKSFYTKVNHIVDQLQARGTLKRLSLHYFHHDFASEARGFKVAALDQQVN
jgi:ABC-type amino acid transport substrate-binding protein